MSHARVGKWGIFDGSVIRRFLAPPASLRGRRRLGVRSLPLGALPYLPSPPRGAWRRRYSRMSRRTMAAAVTRVPTTSLSLAASRSSARRSSGWRRIEVPVSFFMR
jgi:hypothetical protein